VKKLLKWSVALALLASVAGVVAYASLIDTPQRQGRRGSFDRNAPVPVLAAEARLADVPIYFNGVGTARARKMVTVRPQVDGKIISINFKEGQEVKRGDVLAKIDPATYQAQLDQAIAKKALDDVQLLNAKRDLERYTQLGSNIIAAKTIDTQRALVGQLEAQVRADEAAISNAKTVLDYTTIVSPIDGRTGIRMVDEGNLVRASDAGLVVITEIRPISVVFTLPQQQLAAVNKVLAQGPVTVDALDTDGRVPLDRGTLQVVDNQVDQTTGTVRMKADFPNSNLQLWPGQFVNVRVLMETLKQVVVIPTPAVQRGPSGAFAYVVDAEDTVSQRPLEVRHQDDAQAVIAQGVQPAERVVTTGFARLKDGTRVAVSAPQEQQGQQPTPAAAPRPEARSSARAACAADVQRLCAEAERSRGAIRECLKLQAAQLSEPCREAMAAGNGGGREQPREARKERRATRQ
jgi:multidrug efflux system membrane fusion protein